MRGAGQGRRCGRPTRRKESARVVVKREIVWRERGWRGGGGAMGLRMGYGMEGERVIGALVLLGGADVSGTLLRWRGVELYFFWGGVRQGVRDAVEFFLLWLSSESSMLIWI